MKNLFLFLGIACFIVAGVLALFLQDKPIEPTNLTLEEQLAEAYQEGYHKAVRDMEFIHTHHK